LEGEEGDLGGAVEAEGQPHSTDSAIDVELHAVQLVKAFGIDSAHGRQDERSEEGKLDLSAVRVAGKHQVDKATLGMGGDLVGEVGFVGHQDYWTVGFSRDGKIQVRPACTGVIYAGEPDTIAFALDGGVLVDENGCAVGGEGLGYQRTVESDVMIAEDGVAVGSLERGEDFGTAVDGVPTREISEGAMGDEVARKQDEVGGEVVDFFDDVFEEEGFGEFVKVDVADLGDAIAVKGTGEIGQVEGAVDDVDLVTANFARVEGQTSCGRTCSDEEFSPGDSLRRRHGINGHSS
jgi:hypothetical protein